ncbi:PiggyBac transposable element-derived protein 4-like 21 [Homarus americanus]|uniref:PiggyBac transposable element-derived protein 4-like 21 n=1 Tax=Homarus americanus TaxID=6706 RepID=A0A8J5JHZ1_HOMAM|nr:PiggyBac transposable element-derived protein 4-like 21 [Homarus americanus]
MMIVMLIDKYYDLDYVTNSDSSSTSDNINWVQPQILCPSPTPPIGSQDPPFTPGSKDAGCSWLFTPRASRRRSQSGKREAISRKEPAQSVRKRAKRCGPSVLARSHSRPPRNRDDSEESVQDDLHINPVSETSVPSKLSSESGDAVRQGVIWKRRVEQYGHTRRRRRALFTDPGTPTHPHLAAHSSPPPGSYHHPATRVGAGVQWNWTDGNNYVAVTFDFDNSGFGVTNNDFTNESRELIVREINSYFGFITSRRILSPQLRLLNWYDMIMSEIYTFLALVMLMGLVKKNVYLNYWTTHPLLSTPIFGKAMYVNRFSNILRFLFFNNLQSAVYGDVDSRKRRSRSNKSRSRSISYSSTSRSTSSSSSNSSSSSSDSSDDSNRKKYKKRKKNKKNDKKDKKVGKMDKVHKDQHEEQPCYPPSLSKVEEDPIPELESLNKKLSAYYKKVEASQREAPSQDKNTKAKDTPKKEGDKNTKAKDTPNKEGGSDKPDSIALMMNVMKSYEQGFRLSKTKLGANSAPTVKAIHPAFRESDEDDILDQPASSCINQEKSPVSTNKAFIENSIIKPKSHSKVLSRSHSRSPSRSHPRSQYRRDSCERSRSKGRSIRDSRERSRSKGRSIRDSRERSGRSLHKSFTTAAHYPRHFQGQGQHSWERGAHFKQDLHEREMMIEAARQKIENQIKYGDDDSDVFERKRHSKTPSHRESTRYGSPGRRKSSRPKTPSKVSPNRSDRFGKWDKEENNKQGEPKIGNSLTEMETFVEAAKQKQLELMKERNKEFLKPPVD